MKPKDPPVTFPSEDSRRLSPLLTKEQIAEKYQAWDQEDRSKLLELCQHFSIEQGPSMFYWLALVLARELYPESKKSGAESKWTEQNGGALVVEIDRLVQPGDKTHGVKWAAAQLACREPWKSFIRQQDAKDTTADPAEVLRHAYYEFKDGRWAKLALKVFKRHEHEGTGVAPTSPDTGCCSVEPAVAGTFAATAS